MPNQPASGESDGERGTESNTDTDQVLNPETRRALREWGRRGYAVGAGLITALVMLIPTAVTAARSPGIAFHLAVTLVFSLILPVAAVYVGVRAYGLTHHEIVSAARHAAREGAAATTMLGEHQRVEQSAEQPTEPIDTDPTVFTNSDTDDTK